jgi:hypothetical protein
MVQRTNALITGDSILKYPNVTKSIGVTPIWAASEVDNPSFRNLGTEASFSRIFLSNSKIDPVAKKDRIKPRSPIQSGFKTSITKADR